MLDIHRCSQKFLIFFIQEKSLDDLHNQHTEYLRKYIFCSLLSRKAAPVMTIISDLGTLILKLRAQLLASPWHLDPSTGHVTHPAHDIMPNTHNVFKEYSTFLFTGEMFRETTFFLRNSSFTVLGTGECVRCNRGLLNIVSCRAKNWFFFFFGFLFCFVLFCFIALSPFTFFRASGNFLVFGLNSHWLLVIAFLSLI